VGREYKALRRGRYNTRACGVAFACLCAPTQALLRVAFAGMQHVFVANFTSITLFLISIFFFFVSVSREKVLVKQIVATAQSKLFN
jgi:hypothetical protein